MSEPLVQWRPGCFARNGETVEMAGSRFRFFGGAWWQWDGDHLWPLDEDDPAFLRSFPIAPERPGEGRRPGWGFGTAKGRNDDRA